MSSDNYGSEPAPRPPARSQVAARGSRATSAQANLGTAAALFGLCLGGLVFLGMLAAVGLGPLIVAVLGVPMFIGMLTLFHYVTWGWWMSQIRDDDPDRQ